MVQIRRVFAALAAVMVLSAGTARAAELEHLDIQTASGPHDFKVEVMHTEAEREKGLMYRRFMPADRGMLFDFKKVEPIMMWMKNTYIPLDMVFIGPDGRVTGAAENAEPMSERIIPSGGPVLAVLELNAGTVAKFGIKAGDKVDNAMFPH